MRVRHVGCLLIALVACRSDDDPDSISIDDVQAEPPAPPGISDRPASGVGRGPSEPSPGEAGGGGEIVPPQDADDTVSGGLLQDAGFLDAGSTNMGGVLPPESIFGDGGLAPLPPGRFD